MRMTVIDRLTGKRANAIRIVENEEWAQHLLSCDIDGFLLTERGELYLVDDCDNIAVCPEDRFDIILHYEPTDRFRLLPLEWEPAEDTFND